MLLSLSCKVRWTENYLSLFDEETASLRRTLSFLFLYGLISCPGTPSFDVWAVLDLTSSDIIRRWGNKCKSSGYRGRNRSSFSILWPGSMMYRS